MYENQITPSVAGQAGGLLCGPDRNLTVAQNIEQRIAQLQEQIERLQRVRDILKTPEGILNVPISDLRFAMQY